MRFFSSSLRLIHLIVLSVFFGLIAIALAQTNGRDEPDQLLKHDSFELSPAIVSTAITVGYSELAYRYPVEIRNIDGFPVEFALDVAPAGMTIDAQTGVIEWTTPQVGLHEVTVLVWDTRAHFDEQGYTLEIIDGFGGPQILSNPPLTVPVNTLYDYLPEVENLSGMPLQYELLMHPPGMSIDPDNGRIRWLPDVEGDFDIAWQVTDAFNASDQQDFTLSVTPLTGKFSVGGQATGLDLTDVVLLETVSGQRLALSEDGAFAFLVNDDASYAIAIEDQSSNNAVCYITESSGQIAGGNVDNVRVQCVPGSGDPEALIEEAELLADSGATMTTEAFEQTEYAQNQLSEAESRKIDRNHALVIAAVDPDPAWISTRFDSDRIVVTQPGAEHTINAVKLDIDFNEIGPVDADRLKFEVRIQREDHQFEWLPREFATDIVEWTGVPGQFSVRVPDDLTRGRLVIGLRPDFEDVGQTAIAERWSDAFLFEIWPVREGVLRLEPADVLFPVDFAQPLDPTSSFSLADIESITSASGEVLLPLVVNASVQVAVDDLLEYQIGSDPYSGRVASIQQRNGQQLLLLHPDWMDVYDIADADDDFLTEQGVLPELVTYRVGDAIPEFDEPYRRFETSLELDDDATADAEPNDSASAQAASRNQSSSSDGFFIKRCESGDQNTVLAISPRISIAPFDARVDVSVATGSLLSRVDCTWDANPNKRFPNALKFAGPAALVAAKVLGTEITPRPIGRFTFRNEADLGAIEAIKFSFSTRNGIKNNFPSDLADYTDFHSLDGNPVSISSRLGGNVGIGVVANAFGTRGILGKLARFFAEDLVEVGIELSVTTGMGIAVSGANAGAVYRGQATTKAGLQFNLCAKLALSNALRNLFRRLVSVDPSIQLCVNEAIPIGDPASQFNAEDVDDDLQGKARIQTITALPVLASFFGLNPVGRLAPDDPLSSVYNDVHNEIEYDLNECDNNPSGDIETPVITCAGVLCGRTEPIRLCSTQLWVSPTIADAVAGETAMADMVIGATSRRQIQDLMVVDVAGAPLIPETNEVYLSQSRPERTIQTSAECGPGPSVERSRNFVESIVGDQTFEASSVNLLTCRCEPGSSDCDRVWGSPHLISPDGLALDYYASGDYILSHIPGVDGMRVQARYLPGMGVSWPQAVAMQVGSDIVEIHSQTYEPFVGVPTSHRLRIKINGVEIVRPGLWLAHINSPIVNLPGGGMIYINQFIRRFGGLINDPIHATVLWPEEGLFENYGVIVKGLAFDQVDAVSGDLDDVPPIMEITLVRPDELAGMETGMLGNNDGDPSNDLQLRDGTHIEFSDNLSWTELYALFGANWLVRPYECLFADGCIDPEFPLSPEPIDPDLRQFAEAACFELQGWYREACIHDVALSGSTELVEGLYENINELNGMADQLVLPGVDIPLFELQQGAVEKVGHKELYHFSVELIEGQGEYALSLIPPRGTTAVIASTGQGSLVDSQPRVDTVELTCIPNVDWQQLDSALPEQGSLQLWAIDPLSGSPRTKLGEIILPAERIGEYCTDLRAEIDSTFTHEADLNLQNVGTDILQVQIEPANSIELSPEALADLLLCPGCELNLNLAHKCTGGLQNLGTLKVYGSDDILQEERPLICKTISSSLYPFLAVDDTNGTLLVDEDGHLWNLHHEVSVNEIPGYDQFYQKRPKPIEFDVLENIEIKQIATGNRHTLVLDEDGTIWSWGRNIEGQLGIPSCVVGDPAPCNDFVEEPVQIPVSRFDAPIDQVFAAGENSFALDIEGKLWSWGREDLLGNTEPPHIDDRSTPQIVQFVSAPDTRIATVAAQWGFTIAYGENGKLWAWGNNLRGELGLGRSAPNFVRAPTELDTSVFNGADLVMINAGDHQVIALDEFGKLWGWGSNRYDNLTNEPGSGLELSLPQLLVMDELQGLQFDWAIAGERVSMGRSQNGSLWTWGTNIRGELGAGDYEDREGPVQVDLHAIGTSPVISAVITELFNGSSLILYDATGRVWGWGDSLLMPSGFNESSPQLLVDKPGSDLAVDFDHLTSRTHLFSGLDISEAVAAIEITHSGLELKTTTSVRIDDSRFFFAETGTNQLTLPTFRTIRTVIMASGLELCSKPEYSTFDITIVDENNQSLAQDFISIECLHPLQIELEKSLDYTQINLENQGPNDLQLTISGLDGLSHEVLNTYSHSVCAGCYLKVQINELCPVIGRSLVARISIQDTQGTFSESRDIDCGRLYSRVGVLEETTFIVDNEGQAWGWGKSDLLGSDSDQPIPGSPVRYPIEIGRSSMAENGFGRMNSDLLSYPKDYTLTIGDGGLLWSWGRGESGELGNGTHEDLENASIELQPVRVEGALRQAKIVDYNFASFHQPIALDHQGRFWGWGSNRTAYLGNAIPADQPLPKPAEIPTAIRTIASSHRIAYALSKDGLELWAWGINLNLDNDFPYNLENFQVSCIPNGSSGICPPLSVDLDFLDNVPIRDITATFHGTFLLDALGRVWHWGELGNTLTNTPKEVDLSALDGAQVIGITSHPAVRAASTGNSLFLYDQNGQLWALGGNEDGLLGIGYFTTSLLTPTKIDFPAKAGRIKEMVFSENTEFALAVDEYGCFWAWGGENSIGGHVLDRGSPFLESSGLRSLTASPVPVLSDFSPVCYIPDIEINQPLSTVLNQTAEFEIRLDAPYSKTKDLELYLQIDNPSVAALQTDVAIIPAGETTTSGPLSIQGISQGSTTLRVSATTSSEIQDYAKTVSVFEEDVQKFIEIDTKGSTLCAIGTDDSANCWTNFGGQDLEIVPGYAFKDIAVGQSGFICGITTDNYPDCWGFEGPWKSGYPPDLPLSDITSAFSHSCGLLTDESVLCWGRNNFDQAAPPDGQFRSVHVGDLWSCGIRVDHTVACWGRNDLTGNVPAGQFKQLSMSRKYACGVRLGSNAVVCWGEVPTEIRSVPQIPLTEVSSGARHACGIDVDGNPVCWGSNDQGQSNPSGVNATDLIDIAAGFNHSCGLKTSGDIVCWGETDWIDL